jgi:phospholipase C
MIHSSRRAFLRALAGTAGASAALSTFPPILQKALAIPANHATGSIRDVEHIVILMQENRSFDHYFGTLPGVRGFGDRFPIPVKDVPGVTGKNVWYQTNDVDPANAHVVAPFHLDTQQTFEVMRVTGTPHTWPNAVNAWADGQIRTWPTFKNDHAMGYFTEADVPFQFAMANAFTICDAYHCSFHGGTNPNRLFLWTGSNDPLQIGNGPALYNDYDNVENDPDGGYTWVTYCERLEQAGIRWQIYQNMADNFTDNPVAGFRSFRDAYSGKPGALSALLEKGLSTRDLDLLKEDVVNGTLPQVSWIVATAEGSEHPGPSSPAQGADYTAKVLEALTADPDVWSKTVLIVNFDENDGFFDHVPPPAAPSYLSYDVDPSKAKFAGATTVDATGEYHEFLPAGSAEEEKLLLHKNYGPGPRVPLYVVSPWSKGGWVDSECFDHTSVIRFIERRFGVTEPNITSHRRAVCGDLTSAFDFASPDEGDFYEALPETEELAARARELTETTTPPTPELPELPAQATGTRPSRALPYALHVHEAASPSPGQVALRFVHAGRKAAAVFHVYDRKHLDRIPHRYVVEPRKELTGLWDATEDAGDYDLWVLGPNGFHRHFTGNLNAVAAENAPNPEIKLGYEAIRGSLYVSLRNRGASPAKFTFTANAYDHESRTVVLPARGEATQSWGLRSSGYWYDFTLTVEGLAGYTRRFAGRIETGRDSCSDPALGGPAIGDQLKTT